MLTQIFNSINWVDVMILILTVRFVFIAVKNGFIAEVCKFLGVFLATLAGLHWYVDLAAWIYVYLKGSLLVWQIVSLLTIIIVVGLLFWLIRLGLSKLFTAQAQHEGFNKYAAGLVAIARIFLVSSLVMFCLLLTAHPWVSRQVFKSISFKVSGQTAVHLYQFCIKAIVGKLIDAVEYNRAVEAVVDQQLR